MAADWQNPTNPLDVNGDSFVAPLDLLIIINELNAPVLSEPVTGALPVPPTPPNPPPFLDVSGDNFVSFLDQTIVVDALNGITTSVSPSGNLVRIRLETSDASGDLISTVGLGSMFFLNVFVEDIHDEPTGVGGAFVDVRYEASLAMPSGAVTPGESFTLRSADLTAAGLLDEIGGLSAGGAALGEGEFLLFSVPFSANAIGIVTFVTEPADIVPMHDVLLSGLAEPVPSERVIYGGTSLTIVPEPSTMSLCIISLLGFVLFGFDVSVIRRHPGLCGKT